MDLLRDYWLLILIGAIVVALLAYLAMRPRQRVQLNQDRPPLRPHMAAEPKREGRGITDEAAAAASDVTGHIIDAPVHANLPGASGPPDDLTRLKGVGPKFASTLNELGIIRFEQLASLGEAEVERVDQHLGAFRGRLQRDQIPAQAEYLARGDEDGFEQRFGKL